MARKAKATRRGAKRAARAKGLVIRFPGPEPTPAQRKRVKDVMGLIELGILALSEGIPINRQCDGKRRRRRRR